MCHKSMRKGNGDLGSQHVIKTVLPIMQVMGDLGTVLNFQDEVKWLRNLHSEAN